MLLTLSEGKVKLKLPEREKRDEVASVNVCMCVRSILSCPPVMLNGEMVRGRAVV